VFYLSVFFKIYSKLHDTYAKVRKIIFHYFMYIFVSLINFC